MSTSRLLAPSMAFRRPCLACLETAMQSLQLASRQRTQPRPLPRLQVRYASHKSEGRANGPRDGAGKRLGCKKTQGQYVIPGNIIFKQRGTKWYPGDNVGLGRDHTLYATKPGYVRFYRDPARHPDKKYIGVALREDDRLPRPLNCPTRRILGMTAVKMVQPPTASLVITAHGAGGEGPEDEAESRPGGTKSAATPALARAMSNSLTTMRPGYQFRVANWEIGRTPPKRVLEPYDPNDRFAAWRKRTARRAKSAGLRAVKKAQKLGKGKGKGRKK